MSNTEAHTAIKQIIYSTGHFSANTMQLVTDMIMEQLPSKGFQIVKIGEKKPNLWQSLLKQLKG